MSYEPTTWKKGDKVTSTKLNKIEQGIQGNNTELANVTEDVSHLKEDLTLWRVEDGVLKRHSITKVMIETENDFELLNENDFPTGTVAFLADYSQFWYKKADGTWVEIVSSSESKKAIVGQAIVGQAVIGD